MNELPEGPPPQLPEAETAVLRDLSSDDVVKLAAALTADSSLLTRALQSIAPAALERARRAIDSQYLTLGGTASGEDSTGPGRRYGMDDDGLSLETARAVEAELDRLIATGGAGENLFSSDVLARMAEVTPLRLSYEERFFLRLLEATLQVSEYTDKVDVLLRCSAAKRMAREIKELCAILSGLVVANHYEAGQRLVMDRDFADNAAFFKEVFEIGRRYKILNPERMRDSYGKLMYFLMDSRRSDVRAVLDFDCVSDVKTVGGLLADKSRGAEFLADPLLPVAIAEVMPANKSQDQVQSEIIRKEMALKKLINKYAADGGARRGVGGSIFQRITQTILLRGGGESNNTSSGGSSPEMGGGDELLCREDIEHCVYSLRDFNTFLRFNRDPVDRMIKFLQQHFTPDGPESPELSLSIQAGLNGARLSHNHARQYNFALQSLCLWREVLQEMIPLWTLAEKDLLEPGNAYRLADTGQGLNRVQNAPRLGRAMYRIIGRVQHAMGQWCGSTAVHLGDHAVPNALVFIDKYLQVPRILSPLVLVLDQIPALAASSPALRAYIDSAFGGQMALRKSILADFFRHAFDGSGADNFYDAGSCIDGRLTSAWNWCARIERKPYYPVFLLAGFQSFDGRF